jgi:hypothetical protein
MTAPEECNAEVAEGGSSHKVSRSDASKANGSYTSHRVMVEEYIHDENEKPIGLLPEISASSLQGQRCTVKVYNVDSNNQTFGVLPGTTIVLSAFLAEIDRNGNYIVELRCDHGQESVRKNVSFRFEFQDQVRKVQLLPLPLKTTFQYQTEHMLSRPVDQTLGVLLVVVSKRGGMSVHSVVLSRTSKREPFRIAEFKKVARGCMEETGDLIEVSLFLDYAQDGQGRSTGTIDPILYAGVLPKSSSTRSQRLDILACPLVSHQSPLFRFKTQGPTRALKRSMVLTGTCGSPIVIFHFVLCRDFLSQSLIAGAGSATAISISARRVGTQLYCTVATLFDSELKVFRLPSLDKWTTESLKSEDISVVPLDKASLGESSMVCHLRGPESSQHVLFLVVCRQRDHQTIRAIQTTPMLSLAAFEAYPDIDCQEKKTVPPQWTSTATRNAVLRARRDILVQLAETPHGDDNRKRSLMSMPQLYRDVLLPHESVLQDENSVLSIQSPETAMLDMGGKWLGTLSTLGTMSTSDSVLSSLAGLNVDGVDDVTLPSSRSGDESFEHLWQTCNRERPCTDPVIEHTWTGVKLMLVSVPAKDEMSPTDPVRTDIYQIPDDFPSTYDALWVKELENEIVLTAIETGSSKASILGVPFKHGRFDHSASLSNAARSAEVTLADGATVKAMDFEIDEEGQAVLRAITTRTKNVFHVQEESSVVLCEHMVQFKSLKVPLEKRNIDDLPPSQDSKEEKSDEGTSHISEKLEMIMAALHKFESSLNERLDLLEKREIENAKRLSRLERSVKPRSTRAEF